MSDLIERKGMALRNAWAESRADGDYHFHLRQLAKLELEQIAADRHLGINHVTILASGPGGRSCPACTALNGKILSLDREILRQTIPIQGCTCPGDLDNQTGFCLCIYQCVFDDEL